MRVEVLHWLFLGVPNYPMFVESRLGPGYVWSVGPIGSVELVRLVGSVG